MKALNAVRFKQVGATLVAIRELPDRLRQRGIRSSLPGRSFARCANDFDVVSHGRFHFRQPPFWNSVRGRQILAGLLLRIPFDVPVPQHLDVIQLRRRI